MVNHAKEYIQAGDIFQVVLSQRFETDFEGDALQIYRTLRYINPSPYLFCFKFADEFALVGSSPEVHVRAIEGNITIRPIAGTRKRGATPEEDAANAEELLADPKERAEHLVERLALLDGEPGIPRVFLRPGQIDLAVGDVHVAAENHRLSFFEAR